MAGFLLNLPKKVSKGTGSLEYIYDAAGSKQAKILNGTVVNFYCGSMVYTGSKVVEYVAHSEGIAHKSGSTFSYQYNQTDHLGNVRSVADASKAVVQATDYFPFGLAHTTTAASLAKNKYLYNGKELQNDVVGGTPFGQLDYGARMYDATLGRFNNQDRFAEKYFSFSPYQYCINNPIKHIDINGDSIAILNMGYGKNQHLAILIQNNDGKWQYFSINGNNGYISGRFTGGRQFNDIAVGKFSSSQEFLQSSYNSKGNSDDKHINTYDFQEAYILPTNEDQDNTIRENFIKISEEEYSLNPLNPNQCATAVQKSLNKIGIKTSYVEYIKTNLNTGYFIESNPYLPSRAFNAIIKNNPKGQLIKK